MPVYQVFHNIYVLVCTCTHARSILYTMYMYRYVLHCIAWHNRCVYMCTYGTRIGHVWDTHACVKVLLDGTIQYMYMYMLHVYL